MLTYECDLVWAKSEEWQNWIHSKEIELGQPCLKEDKKSRKLDMPTRCKCRKSVAHPGLQNISEYATEHRIYFPKSLDQALQFMNELTGKELTVTFNGKVWYCPVIKEKGLTWYELATIIMRGI